MVFGHPVDTEQSLTDALHFMQWAQQEYGAIPRPHVARSFFPDVQGIVWFSSYMMYNFIAMALIVLVSSKIISKVTIKNVGMSILLASIIFFIITNFGAWADEKSLYSSDFSGLMASFMAGIPFFRNSLLSNIIFTTVIFGSFEIYTSIATRQKSTAGS